MENIKEIKDASRVGGSSLLARVLLAPRIVVKCLGEGTIFSNPEKVTREYIFEVGISNKIFTLYDWKATDAYDKYLPNFKDFWESENPTWFSIGAHEHTLNFLREVLNFLEMKTNSLILPVLV